MMMLAMANLITRRDPAANEPGGPDKFGFLSTLWTLEVIPAGSPDEQARLEALSRLLEKYQSPLKAYLRAAFWKFHLSEDWINDCFQSFVLQKVMLRNLIAKANRQRGRFRDFLKRCLYHFAIEELRAGKEPIEPLDSDFADNAVIPGTSAGDIEWARAVLHEALKRTKTHFQKKRKDCIWAVFERRRLGGLSLKTELESMRETAEFLRRTFGRSFSPQDISNQLKTAERSVNVHVRDLLTEYCRDDEEIKEELARLVDLLREGLGDGDNNAKPLTD